MAHIVCSSQYKTLFHVPSVRTTFGNRVFYRASSDMKKVFRTEGPHGYFFKSSLFRKKILLPKQGSNGIAIVNLITSSGNLQMLKKIYIDSKMFMNANYIYL